MTKYIVSIKKCDLQVKFLEPFCLLISKMLLFKQKMENFEEYTLKETFKTIHQSALYSILSTTGKYKKIYCWL